MQAIARAVEKHGGNMRLVSRKYGIPYTAVRKAVQQSQARERITRFRRQTPGSLFQFDLSRSRYLILHRDGTIEAADTTSKGYYRDKEGKLIRLWIGAIVDDATSNLRFQYFILEGGESFINLISVLYSLLSVPPEMPLPYGLPRQLLIDRSSGFAWNDHYFARSLSKHMRVIFAQKAQTKGKVERQFRTIKSTFEADLLGSGWRGTIDELNRLALQFSIAFNKEKEKHFTPNVKNPDILLSSLFRIRTKQAHRGILEVDGNFYYLPQGFAESRIRYFVHEGQVFAIVKNSIVKLSPSGRPASIMEAEELPDIPIWSEKFYREDKTIFIKPRPFETDEGVEEEEFKTGGDWI